MTDDNSNSFFFFKSHTVIYLRSARDTNDVSFPVAMHSFQLLVSSATM